ncbi:MAG: MBL fold metallo-hydrolase, partial [Candidatus Acidiferrum sp.]
MEQVFLRKDVQVEPLIDQWYAWPHLIPPATAARNLTERHMRIMQSYISAPQIHASAVKNPKMLGGPFVDYGGERVDEIKALLNSTTAERACLLQLSRALEELDRMVQSRATGESLHSLYAQVPEVLKGYVELVYDLNNHPSFRLIEPLLYQSPFYKTEAQSIMLSRISGDDRPFVLSTPRLPTPGSLHLKLPFASEAIDSLFAAKSKPKPLPALIELCGISGDDEVQFSSFFTTEKPRPYLAYKGRGVRWRYFGHACILLETQSVNFLFDPVLSYTYQTDISRYTYEDLPDRIDFVLITHNHQDHVLFETMLQLRNKTSCVVVPRNGSGALQDPSLRLTLEAIGFKNIVELDEMQALKFDGGSVTGLPFFGEHADLSIRTKLAYLVELNGHRFLFAADSCNIEPTLYRHIARQLGEARALFVGMECDG